MYQLLRPHWNFKTYGRLFVCLRKAQLCTQVDPSDKVAIHYQFGLPTIQVPLPSRQEVCNFTVRPLLQTVTDLLDHIKQEDGGIDYLAIYDTNGVKISKSTPIDVLLKGDFDLVINNQKYRIDGAAAASHDLANIEEEHGMSRLKTMIHQLYTGLNVEEFEAQRERELRKSLQELNDEIAPLHDDLQNAATKAERRSRLLMWGGLAFMSLQFGILARLTWWEYSWDIIEPVTYFVTYGTAIIFYANYVLTRKDSFDGIYERNVLLGIHKQAGKRGLNVQKYTELRETIIKVEAQLELLKNSRMALAHSKFEQDDEQK